MSTITGLTAVKIAELIDVETNARQVADTALASDINDEQTARSVADTDLGDAINALDARVDKLESGVLLDKNVQTENYTLVLTDAGRPVEMNNAAARTITVPANADVAFLEGTTIELVRMGAGTVTVVAAAGVTIFSRGGLLAIGNQYASAALRKRAGNEWVLVGDLA